MNSKFPFRLLALLLVLATVFFLSSIGALAPVQAVALVILFQAAMFLVEPRQAALFESVLTPSQIREFSKIMDGMKDYDGMFQKLFKKMQQCGGPEEFIRRYDQNERSLEDLQSQVKKIRKSGFSEGGGNIRILGGQPFVTDDCAKALMAAMVVRASRLEGGMERLNPDVRRHDQLLRYAESTLGMNIEQRTSMSGSDIPLPTVYIPQIVELVWFYGQARQYSTLFPLGSGKVQLPRLKVGEDNFGYMGVGTAGMSQAVPEKRVQAELVEFDANKCGGIIRLPTELEEDTFIPMGQFLARYIARQFAKLEDSTMFLGDGTGTYANQLGVGPYCAANNAYLQQLGAGKTKPTDATIADFRALRGKVNPALLAGGYNPCYYCNPTFESMFRTFNQYPANIVYSVDNTGKATLDGFPVRWIGVSQSATAQAAAGSYLAFFGDLSFWYLGERGAPRIEVSREVYFTTDEIGMRALERIDVNPMAVDAMSALQTAAV